MSFAAARHGMRSADVAATRHQAATLAASVTNTPAEAAYAPAGETKTTTGNGAASKACTMSRVVESKPPGVSSVMTKTPQPSSFRFFYRLNDVVATVPGLIEPCTSIWQTSPAIASAFGATG